MGNKRFKSNRAYFLVSHFIRYWFWNLGALCNNHWFSIMKFNEGINKNHSKIIQAAADVIMEKGTAQQKRVLGAILDSEMLVCVGPVSEVKASGITGLINPSSTNDRIESERLSLKESLGEVFITFAAETIDGAGARGCEGTLVHEAQHAFDFAQVIESFSNSDLNPLSVFNPSLYELEWAAHKTSGEYMLQIAKDDYLQEGLDLMILGRDEKGFFVSDEGIKRRLRENYGLEENGNQGSLAGDLVGIRQR